MGVVHSVLGMGTIFEVAKHLDDNMPASSLKPAYEMVENMLESGREQESPEEDAQEMGEEPGEMQQPMMQHPVLWVQCRRYAMSAAGWAALSGFTTLSVTVLSAESRNVTKREERQARLLELQRQAQQKCGF